MTNPASAHAVPPSGETELPAELRNDPQRAAIPVAAGLIHDNVLLPDVAPPSAHFGPAPAAPVGPAIQVDALEFARRASALTPASPERPLVEPMAAPPPQPEAQPLRVVPLDFAPPTSVSHRNSQTDFTVSQGARGTCWAFAGCAALEAAYARKNIHVKLSEHYLFHISKAHENHVAGPGIHSLVGFQGSSDIVHHLKYWRVPIQGYAPYIDQPALQALADSIPGTGGALKNAGAGTREQDDWFEYDLRSIPLNALWFAQYGVADFGTLNSTVNDIKTTLAAGYDVVVDVFDKINNGGHVLLIFGYDDGAQEFQIKNSQSLPGFGTMKYVNDGQFQLQGGSAYFIKSVADVQTQWAAMWVGRWETDHDGWRGKLVIRRFLDIRANTGVPPTNAPISLGSWYGEDGRVLPVDGGFVDGGRGLHCTIGGQPFQFYLHSSDPYRAAGRVLWNNTWFGVVMSRGTAVGAGSNFDRTETIGLWDTVHDGWRGQARIGVDPSYTQAADGAVKRAWIDPGNIVQQVDYHVDFGGSNRDQHFQLLHHTHEDGLMGGVTQWGGRDWPVEARMSPNLYSIADDGKLRWYHHTGRYRRVFEWDDSKEVGTGWNAFKSVFGGRDGVIYAIQPDGRLMWYYHDGRNQGTFQWQGPSQVGTGWQNFRRVFAGDGGVIYAVEESGALHWYRHQGRRDGSFRWQDPAIVGSGWNSFVALAAGPDGVIYGTLPDGRMMWYRHYGYDQGYPIWVGAIQVGSGWQDVDRIWIAGNGFVYGRKLNGELWCWRHHGYLNGTGDWTPGARVGTGWTVGFKEVFLT
ncbi:hypothetical protein CCR94_00275 [Rhodoblastus sphagnicola]|uniref:Tachylectin 2 domain-containing protein n=1 Tax=Rhodoblastus sphagnicola TaxID=333368 RepID=A0A2S6NHF2_9HYPH|nr:tachylectin-related carbohydrate-binding protein [Rhodoblastus sphagnicola]MBB4200874.1 hypothetical protein [Rhodoblastus sphagnicola]PPQ33979.1 hypothetical protein CCR94_00275 [Rhodoblastus sphagnicola]